jgi:hypothetical protein
MINWNISVGVRHMNIYDPFGNFDENLFKNWLSNMYKLGYRILYVNGTSAYDINKEKEVKFRNIKASQYDIIVTYITFTDGNENLIGRMIKEGHKLPIQYSYITHKHESISEANDYKNFLTKKSADYLPELILYFGTNALCLYGYPFTMLENAEIM